MKLSAIAQAVGGELRGDGSVEITGVAPLNEARSGEISYLANARQSALLEESGASAFLLPKGVESEGRPALICDNPPLLFAAVVELFHPAPAPRGILPGAVIEEDALLGEEVTVYPGAYVGRGGVLGDRVVLYPGVFVGEGCRIGEGTVLYPNVVVMAGTEVGRRVIIHGGTVIGSDGYGFVWDGKKHRKVPQVGRVVIGDDVEIGANCAIDRAALSRTEIRRGTKIDNLVHIAHNCIVGEDSLLTGQVGLSGSVKLGRNVILAGQTGVAGHLTIGDGVIVGARSGVTKDIAAGERVTGYPPLPHMEWLRAQKSLEKLPEMRKSLKELAERIEKIEKSEANDA